MARNRRPRDGITDNWETWRVVLAVFCLLMLPFMTIWIGVPVGLAAVISLGGTIAVSKGLYSDSDPRLQSPVPNSQMFKFVALLTRAKQVYSQYWETFKSSKPTFFSMFFKSVGTGMPFPDMWHLTAEEQRAFEESEANAPASIRDYSTNFSWKSLIPKRLSTIWSLVFALLVGLIEIPISMLTTMTVSWGFSLPFFISYPISVTFLFFLAQFYCITRLTQGVWGGEKALIPAPAIMINRMTKEHWKPGLFTSSLFAIGMLVAVGSFVVGVGLPYTYGFGAAIAISLIVAAVVVSYRAKKPWRQPWSEYIAESQMWSNAFLSATGDVKIPTYVSSSQYPVESEMDEIVAEWRERRDAGDLTDEEAEEAPKTTNKLAVFLYSNTGLKPSDMFDVEEELESHLQQTAYNVTLLFPERESADGSTIPGTVTDEGFQVLYSTDPKHFSMAELVARRYSEWDQEIAIHSTVLREVREHFNSQVQLVDATWHTTPESPSQLLEITAHPINDRFSRNDFENFARQIEQTNEVKWLRTRLSSSADARNSITILLSNNPEDERMEFVTSSFVVNRMIQEANWTYVFRRSNLVADDGTLPDFAYNKKSTDLVTTSSFMLPTALSREDVKPLEDEFKKFSGNEFIEIKGGWDYKKTDRKKIKERAKHAKAFSVLSAPRDPLDQEFLFGNYSQFTLKGRKENYEQIDWVVGINSADQPANDSFIKGDAPHLLVAGESGSGKPLSPETLVWTHAGVKKISDLKSGELILGANGKFSRVKNVFPTRPEADTYVLSFDGGEEVQAAGKHLWSTSVEVSVRPGSEDSSMVNYHALDDLKPQNNEARSVLRSGIGQSIAGEPLNIRGRLPVPLNFQYSLGVGESSPEAVNARAVAAMRGIPPQIAAVLTVFSKNKRPDGHIIVNDKDAAVTLFSAAGYELIEVEQFKNGSTHLWCEDIHALISQIDFDNTDYPFFTTSMSGSSMMTIDVDLVRAECAAAVVNCFVPSDFHIRDKNFFSSNSSIIAGHEEMFARLALAGFGPRDNGKSSVTMSSTDMSDMAIHREAIVAARQLVSYDALRRYVTSQHAVALGILSMLPKLDELTFVLTHSELIYTLLMCGISVNSAEHNSGLLFVESANAFLRRTTFMPLLEEGIDKIDDEVNTGHVLTGMIAAIGQVHIEDTGSITGSQPIVTVHCSTDRVQLLMDTVKRCTEQHDAQYQLMKPSKRAGEFVVDPQLYEIIKHVLPGNMNPAIGGEGDLVFFTEDDEMEALVDRHTIVRKTGMSYQELAQMLIGVEPEAYTRTAQDIVSPTARSTVHLVNGIRELYSVAKIKRLLHNTEANLGGLVEFSVSPVLTTFALSVHDNEKIKLPYLVDSDNKIPKPQLGDSSDEIRTEVAAADVYPITEEAEMMCITVDSDSHTFMLAQNGLLTHNSVFVQSMLTQLSYNNGPKEVIEWLNDPKIGLQRFMHLDNCERFVDPWTPNTQFFENCAELYSEGVDRMANERNAKLAKTPDPETGIPPEKLGEAREAARREAEADGTNPRDHEMMFPYIFLVQEECATVFADAGSKEEAAYQADVLRSAGRIAREGRSAGVYEICMTQYPTNASIPSQIRNQMRRIGLKCRNSFASNIIIDEDGLEQLYLPGSAMTRDDQGQYRRSRGFLLRNGKPSLGEENDLMEVLGALPKNTTSQSGMSTNVAGVDQVSFGSDLRVDMEMLYDDLFVQKTIAAEDHVNQRFEQTKGSELDAIVSDEKRNKRTRSKLESDADLSKMMEKKGEKNSAPWLKSDESGRPISNAEYQKRSDKPAVPTASGRRSSGRKSRISKR